MIDDVRATYPRMRIIATTLRAVSSETVNDCGAIAWSADDGLVEATARPTLEIFDRVHGEGSFAWGLVLGLLERRPLQEAVDLGAAHGAHAMTTPGDTAMATRAEVERLARGGCARVQR